MHIGLCSSPETADSWPVFPADYLEINVQQQLRPEEPAEIFGRSAHALRALNRTVLAANCFLPGDLAVVGPATDSARLARYARTAFARASNAGIRHIVFGSAGARRVPAGWPREIAIDQFVQALRLLGPLAVAYDITLVVEPLNHAECNLLNTVREGALSVTRADHPNVRLLVDLYHMLRNGEAPAALEDAGPLIAHAHVAEVAARTAPGVAGDDFRPFLRALLATGYTGNLSIECHWGADPCTEAVNAVAELRSQYADATADRPVGARA